MRIVLNLHIAFDSLIIFTILICQFKHFHYLVPSSTLFFWKLFKVFLKNTFHLLHFFLHIFVCGRWLWIQYFSWFLFQQVCCWYAWKLLMSICFGFIQCYLTKSIYEIGKLLVEFMDFLKYIWSCKIEIMIIVLYIFFILWLSIISFLYHSAIILNENRESECLTSC